MMYANDEYSKLREATDEEHTKVLLYLLVDDLPKSRREVLIFYIAVCIFWIGAALYVTNVVPKTLDYLVIAIAYLLCLLYIFLDKNYRFCSTISKREYRVVEASETALILMTGGKKHKIFTIPDITLRLKGEQNWNEKRF